MTVESRRQILRRAIKFVKQQQLTKKKRADCTDKLSWDELVKEVQQSLDHLDKLDSSSFMQELKTSSDSQLTNYALSFDLTRSNQKKLEELLVKVIVDGETPEFVENIRLAGKLDKTASVQAYKHAVQLMLSAIRQPENTDLVLKGLCVPDVLKRTVEQVNRHQEDGGKLVACSDLAEVIRPFCADPLVQSEARLTALRILEKIVALNDEDKQFLLLHRTRAVVSAISTQLAQSLTENEIRSDESRQALFEQLLTQSTQLTQLSSLAQLLLLWPKLASAISNADNHVTVNPWCRLFERMLLCTSSDIGAGEQVLALTSVLHKTHELSPECTKHIADCLRKASAEYNVLAAKCLLLSKYPILYDEALGIIRLLPEDVDDRELFDSILQCLLLPNVVTTAIFNPLADHVLSCQHVDDTATPYYIDIENIVTQLQEAGYQVEAASLINRHRAMHRGGQGGTLDGAFSVFKSFFKR